MAKKVKYHEGDIIAVPLQNGGYATGLVARTDGKGLAFGYFFGPKVDEIPDISTNKAFEPEDAILISLFGDNSVAGKPWPIIGKLPNYSKNIWKLPFLFRQATGDNYYTVSEYSDQLEFTREWKVPLDDPSLTTMSSDGLLGSALLQIKLTRLLD